MASWAGPEHETDAAHRVQQPPLAFRLELSPQIADEHVHDVAVHLEVVAPHVREQLGAREHEARMSYERLEQIELPSGELDRARPSAYLTAGRVDMEVADQHRDARRLGPAAEERVQARHQLGKLVRFGEVVLRSRLECDDS